MLFCYVRMPKLQYRGPWVWHKWSRRLKELGREWLGEGHDGLVARLVATTHQRTTQRDIYLFILTPNHYGLESAKPDLQSVFKKPGGGTAEL